MSKLIRVGLASASYVNSVASVVQYGPSFADFVSPVGIALGHSDGRSHSVVVTFSQGLDPFGFGDRFWLLPVPCPMI